MCLLVFLLFIVSTSLNAFNTLHEAKSLALNLSEKAPDSANNLALNPDYSAYYGSSTPGMFSMVLDFLHIRKLYWKPSTFSNTLAKLLSTANNEQHPTVLIMRPKPETRFIIFGPLFGSFHSLVRCLLELEKEGIIDNELRITKKDTYLIFNGNVIDGSHTILETLTLVLSLMERNRNNVIYIAGQHELEGYWQGEGLKIELDERIGNDAVEQNLYQFFSTLPQAVILASPKKGDEESVQISASSFIKIETSCLKKMQTLELGAQIVCPIDIKNGTEMDPDVIIEAEKRLMNYNHHRGLTNVPAESGATSWAVFSAPNAIYKDNFNFFFDAFTVLTIGPSFAQSSFELFNQDVRIGKGFNRAAVYNLQTGQLIKDPVAVRSAVTDQQKEPLVLGCSLDLSKGASGQGKLVKLGISLCINEQNQEGGINGRRIDVVFMDDEYSPIKARNNVLEFVKKHKSDLFLCNLGSPTTEAYLDLLQEHKIFLFFPITGAPLFRKPDLSVVHWRTSYSNEAKKLTEYVIKTYNAKDIAFMYQNDAYGLGALEGSRSVVKEAGIRAKEIPYERNSTSFKSVIDQVKAAGVDSIGFFATAFASAEFIRQAGVEFFIDKKLFGLSDLAELSFKTFMAQKGIDVVIAQFAPNPLTSQMQIVKEYRKALHNYGLSQEDVFMLEGYISAAITIHILKKAQDASQKSIMKVINSLIDYPFKGLTLTYNPKTGELVHKLWLDVGTPDWIEQKLS